ncbi:uncharacterized protein F5Z01DRAFT_678312 [Emericellopsis atlantica]|uniref:Uncharacterized protein n=1 Tax=Emericellopsis atlantica TaxID=2614577 RepID=A0A9P7ZDV1_9HYPO|nr:uncharacterized protein F5Z01DRAFT_678312 [Emericellopsis atlantica]KAG9249906.1 hypothetical protein F5Z01DRAFT_678312 [Emericellopsis atlantica]
MASLSIDAPEAPMAAQVPETLAPAMPSKPIPLQCCVCPDTPTFSDVSHLLTHIASKGHLHHETQTKLKARQDEEAFTTIRSYDEWYEDNAIESLLIERMKTKQEKDATRSKRTVGSSAPYPPKQSNRKPKRSPGTAVPFIKSEDDEFPSSTGMAAYPGLSLPDHDLVAVEDVTTLGDTMSLKGLIWPGMGKLDLANDEMKRIRNQKKPRSVIEKMRRTSEGVSSEQVVYSPGFEFARTKDVYDELTPDEDGVEPISAKKTVRTKRKKTNALADVSVNIPRRNLKQARRESCAPPDVVKPSKAGGQNIDPELSTSVPPSQRPTPNVFSDEDLKPAFDDQGFAVPTTREHK